MEITIKCKLNPDEKQVKILDKTLSKCLDALNYISKVAWKKQCFNRVALHHLVYYKTKSKFKLTSDICCSIKDKVAFSYKADREKEHVFKKSLITLNFPRTVSLKGLGIVSISTLKGRQKIPLALGEYQKEMLGKATKFCDSELIKRRGKFYLCIVIELPDEPLKQVKGVIGVDLGINNIAVCSNGAKFTGEQVENVRNRYDRLRSGLQSKRTPSAKRHLKKMAGREKKFMRDRNHVISKRIVRLAQESASALALEDLTNIRKTAKHRKKQRRTFHRWSFYQLRQFITYKAQLSGIPLFLVDPAYTSQTCSACGVLGIRNGQSFHCKSCSFSADADWNASLNIASRVNVNLPIVGVEEVKPFLGTALPSETTYKLTALAVSS